MKLRHAAAIVLTGWYLIVPPVKMGTVEMDSPLSRWIIIEEYSDRDLLSCTTAQADLVARAEGLTAHPPVSLIPSQAQQYRASQCIATDDPRLKEK